MAANIVLLVTLLAAPAGATPLGRLGQAFAALRDGDHARARALAEPLVGSLPRARDYALFVAAEAAFYEGDRAKARAAFERLAAMKTSRFAPAAAWRAADCSWTDGGKAAAADRYRRLLAAKTGGGDVALARFRLAEVAEGKNADEARRMYQAVHVEHPSHPLADAAARRLAVLSPAQPSQAPVVTSAPERLKRAATLSEGRQWQTALDELAKLPTDLPAELRPERDYLIGMTKYRMRRDYAGAASLLLGASAQLTGEKSASAAFHGARALSRADRDDEAIVGYDRVVERHGSSRFAAEAQFLGGWLDVNRGKLRAGLPRLEATVKRFPRTEFALDAAWWITLARYLLDEPQPALAALADYERRLASASARDRVDAAGRIAYFRARLFGKLGRPGEERSALTAVAARAPLSYYGMLARARLAGAGGAAPVELPAPPASASLPSPGPRATRDPAIALAGDLIEAGLGWDAGVELARAEAQILQRLGPAEGLAALLDLHRRAGSFRRPYYLAETRGAAAVVATPSGRSRVWWEAAYPLAWKPLIERFGPPAGNPDHLLYAIMRKESGFDPHDTSYADARGLMQMIPPSSERVAKELGVEFHPDELYDPQTNVRLAAAYIGSLHRKFRGQVPLTAGAFNAGPRAMQRWCELNGKRPFDEFVELVTYEQTREYIKRVSSIYAHYRYLYDGQPWLPPMALDCRPERTGPDY